jgi:predicted nucleic acid-binding protein
MASCGSSSYVRMTDVVLDSGPLIHLSELDALDVICDFSSLFIPEAVRDEVGRHQPAALKHSFNLHVISAPSPQATIRILARTLSLDRGELEALSLMELYPHAIFLTDDSAARVAADQRGFKVHGTIGILIRAVRKGHRTGPEVIDILRSLPRRSTLYIKPSLLNEIISSLANEWQV